MRGGSQIVQGLAAQALGKIKNVCHVWQV